MKNHNSLAYKVHFVGIGGVGMSGIAEMLKRTGYLVSGSDIGNSPTIVRLKKIGIEIYIGHKAKVVDSADVLVYSSAIDEENVELIRAKERRIPIISRAQMLSELMRFKKGIAVAGTHGKTTTTSLLATTLDKANIDPTYIVGGILNSISSNAQLGKGEYIVAEADESDASFLQLQSVISIITNIDFDHMGTYRDDPQQLQDTFVDFVHRLPFYGTCIVCIDDVGVQQILPRITRRIITYGFSEEADYQITDYQQKVTLSQFSVEKKLSKTNKLTQWCVNMPGKHNALNALVSIIVAEELHIDEKATQQALREFTGVGRRFDCRQIKNNAKEIMWVDDYAHHPREITATWEAVCEAWQKEQKIIIFQPHRYSRTRDLFDDFITVLSQCALSARLLFITEVYAATEQPITGADTESLIKALRLRNIQNVSLIHNQEELNEVLPNVLQQDDIVISMGAGSISNWLKSLFKVTQ